MNNALNLSLWKYENKPGYLCLANFLNKQQWKQEFFSTQQLSQANEYINEHKQYDSYNSLATFRTTFRNRNNIAIITEHCIDIDNHLSPFSEEQAKEFISQVLEPLYDIAIPTPSLIVYTGRGLQIHFNLSGANDIRKWELTQRALIERLQKISYEHNALLEATGLKIDSACNDSARVFRTINTTNTKANKTTKALYISNNVYSQNEIIENYNLTWTSEKGKQKGKQHKLNELTGLNKEQILKATQRELKEYKGYAWNYTKETLNQARREDLIKIIELRNVKGISEGYRNNLLSIAVQLERESINDINQLAEHLLEYNNYFIEPLKTSEVVSWVRSATKKQIHFSNKYIISKLNLTRKEQEQLSTIISRSVKNSRYYYKNREALNLRGLERYKPTKLINQTNRNLLKLRAVEMAKNGSKVNEICKELNKSRRTIYRYLEGQI